MLTNTTVETINYIKDIEIEYNIKLLIMCVSFIYLVTLIIISSKWKSDDLWVYVIRIWMFRIPSIVILFFSILFPLYLFREISWEAITTLVVAYYSYLIVIGGVAGKLGMFTWAAKLIGINPKFKKMEVRR